MRILFVSDNFYPEVNAPATRTFEHCREWVSAGESVTVITTVPNFPAGKTFPGYRNRFFQKETVAGIEVWRVWSYVTANEGFLKRILDYSSFAVSAFIAGLFVKADVIVGTSPQFFSVIAAAALSFVKRRPWVFELRDLWPASIAAVGAIKNRRILGLLEKIELCLYRNAAVVVALTDAFKKDIMARGIDGDKIKVVPNGSNLDLFFPRDKDRELLKRLGLEGKFVIGYVGTHGMAHGLDFIVRSIGKVRNKDVYFIFVGGGAEKENILKIAGELDVKNSSFIPNVSKEEVVKYMSILDVALVNLKKSEVFLTVLPSKIFEAAAMERPILLGVDGEARKLVEKYGAGIFFEPENEAAFLGAVETVSANKKILNDLKKGCRNLAKDFDRKVLADKMLGLLKEVVNSG
jgi:glycosyltransferase involved in cell wall biosynthesis